MLESNVKANSLGCSLLTCLKTATHTLTIAKWRDWFWWKFHSEKEKQKHCSKFYICFRSNLFRIRLSSTFSLSSSMNKRSLILYGRFASALFSLAFHQTFVLCDRTRFNVFSNHGKQWFLQVISVPMVKSFRLLRSRDKMFVETSFQSFGSPCRRAIYSLESQIGLLYKGSLFRSSNPLPNIHDVLLASEGDDGRVCARAKRFMHALSLLRAVILQKLWYKNQYIIHSVSCWNWLDA